MKGLVESIRVGLDINNAINIVSEELSVNEADGTYYDELMRLTPFKRRETVLRLMKDMFKKSGWDKKYIGVYNDLALYNITTYPKHILEVMFKNNDKAKVLLEPTIKAMSTLFDYSKEYINESNRIFSNNNSKAKKDVFDTLSSDVDFIDNIKEEETFTMIGFMIESKMSKDEVITELNKLKPLYDGFEITSTRGNIYIVQGTYKPYLKELESYKKGLNDKIKKANN